ncbi:cytochrome P450 [Kroppenstedtia pulmonis]|uniref:Cytochrome P450 n=1 Tax=Kroppenstedtia pulmonis TaxID=1380685 RepID=A0A7D4CWH3_9BACL|nr:cytochrome P450 [Kroppenstedtia pulmonis]QKG85017.1 cytochrome P450 [Kroppenstedtia pulmonis]
MSNRLEKENVSTISLFSPDFKEKSHHFYAELRRHDPVHPIRMPSGQRGWMITRYDDAVSVLKDNRFVKNVRSVMEPQEVKRLFPAMEELDLLINHMLGLDPPDHTRLRTLVHKAFTPRMIQELEGRINEIADDLLNRVQNRGRMDLIEDFAFPLPIIVISEMLGIPIEDREKFRDWSNQFLGATNQPEKMAEISPDLKDFMNYLRGLFNQRRNHPREDLISGLVHVKEAGEQLSEAELFAMVFLLIIAGHETTVNLIGNGTLALLEYPEQMEKLKKHPEYYPSAVEELLRYYSPVELATNRWASEDVTLYDKRISQGDLMIVVLASANRDEEQFTDPDRLDITRKNNRHIAFGMGIHYCLGAPLARLEGKIAFETLLRRMPDLRLNTDSEKLEWRYSYLMRGLKSLPVSW